MIYEYHCKNCKKIIELNHSMASPAKKICPACKKKTLKRIISKNDNSFILKGEGWYKDGYTLKGKQKNK